MAKMQLDVNKLFVVNVKIKGAKKLSIKTKVIAFLLGMIKDCNVEVEIIKRGEEVISSHEERLYAMLDDIDTLSDAIKPVTIYDYEQYLKCVTDFASKRHLLYDTDGNKVTRK